MKIIRIDKSDICNGNGVRVVVWIAGCHHHCKNCHNPETWSFDTGTEYNYDIAEEIVQELNKPIYSGITFTGGDPLAPENREDLQRLIDIIRYRCRGKNIWLWTGYLFEDLLKECPSLVRNVDVLIDGKYEESLNNHTTVWCGSSNQRVIDVKRSLSGEIKTLY